MRIFDMDAYMELDQLGAPYQETTAPAVSDSVNLVLKVQATADLPIMVLLVDDQAIIAEVISHALSPEEDINFHYCANADEALDTVLQTRPTVILQDLVMPGIDGLTLVKAYRNNPATRDVPIIVLSSDEESTTKSAAFAAGANDYLVKLPDRIELVARVRYHSRSYVNQQRLNEAYRALRQSQQQLLEANLELQRLTHFDGLTGMSNRRHLDEYLSTEWQRSAADQSEIAVLMIDVDNFKLYNDSYGHIAGDAVLKQIALTVESCVSRLAGLAARFGGEEFAVVLPGASAGSLRLLAEKIRSTVEALKLPHANSPTYPYVTISVGGASVVPTSQVDMSSLIEAADRQLYRAKDDGKNRVAVGSNSNS